MQSRLHLSHVKHMGSLYRKVSQGVERELLQLRTTLRPAALAVEGAGLLRCYGRWLRDWPAQLGEGSAHRQYAEKEKTRGRKVCCSMGFSKHPT